MSSHIGSRLVAALVIGAVWLGALAVPAAAAHTIRYVDDNSTATSCRHTTYHSIQSAINASAPGDTVYVCQGWYHEELLIDVPGLTVQSLSYRKARLVPDGPDGLGAAVVIAADNVKFRGFRIQIPAGEPVPPAAGLPTCSALEAAIVVVAERAGVWGNHIQSIGDATLSGDCGYDMGILFIQETNAAQPSLGHGRSTAKRNYIRDFKLAGILAEGPDVAVRLVNNEIRYVHQDDPFTCVPINTLSLDVSPLAPPCEPPDNASPNPLNGLFGFTVGIGIGSGAKADVAFNNVFSTFEFITFPDLGSSIPLLAGIWFDGAADGSRITENVVTQAVVGIAVDAEGIPLLVPDTSAPDGVEVTYNRASEGFAGFLIDGDDSYVYANRARLNGLGLATFEGSGITFNQNDARYNFFVDCLDETGPGTGTAGTDNTWENNIAFNSDPDEICEEVPGPF